MKSQLPRYLAAWLASKALELKIFKVNSSIFGAYEYFMHDCGQFTVLVIRRSANRVYAGSDIWLEILERCLKPNHVLFDNKAAYKQAGSLELSIMCVTPEASRRFDLSSLTQNGTQRISNSADQYYILSVMIT